MILGINGKIGSGKDTIGSIIQYLVDKDRAGYQHPDSQDDFISYCKNFNPKYCKWKVKKFAGKLKEIAALLTGCTIEQLEDQEFKKQYLGESWRKTTGVMSEQGLGELMTYRELLQKLGTEAMRNGLHTNVWVNALMADYTSKIAEDHQFIDDGKTHVLYLTYPNWIITDMRFPNELEAVKAKDGITIRVIRDTTCPECGVIGGHKMYVHKDKSLTDLHPSETALDDAKFDYEIINDGTIEDLIQKVKVILVKEDIIK